MLPITIFIAYSLSLSAAMTSGGRYLTAMDWVIYFYYGLAIVVIAKFVYKVLAGKDHGRPSFLEMGNAKRISDRRKLGFSLVGIICLASLIPFANFVLPVMTASARNRADMEAVKESISTHENSGASIVYGEILYPYFEDGTLTFVFLTPKGPAYSRFVRAPGLKVKLNSGEYAFITLLNNDQEKSQVESIYLWQDANPELIWKHQP
jgi:hypothetical protein